MALSPTAQELVDQVAADGTAAGTLKKLAKAAGTDHALAMELWSTGNLNCRLVAVLLMDKKQLDQELVDALSGDMAEHVGKGGATRIMEWLMANKLLKSAAGRRMVASWETAPSRSSGGRSGTSRRACGGRARPGTTTRRTCWTRSTPASPTRTRRCR